MQLVPGARSLEDRTKDIPLNGNCGMDSILRELSQEGMRCRSLGLGKTDSHIWCAGTSVNSLKRGEKVGYPFHLLLCNSERVFTLGTGDQSLTVIRSTISLASTSVYLYSSQNESCVFYRNFILIPGDMRTFLFFETEVYG